VVEGDHGLALAPALEEQAHLVKDRLEVAREQRAQHPDDPHVLSALRGLGGLAGLLLDGDLPHVVAPLEEVLEGLGVGLLDLRVGARPPLAVDEEDRPGSQRPLIDAAVEHLLVEGDDDVGLVAHVGHRLVPEADADSAGPLAGARRRLDLRGDDLHRPDPVPHLGADRSEQLARRLRTLARVADDLDDLLADALHGGVRVGLRRPAGGGDRIWRGRSWVPHGRFVSLLA
jgi:hypothetical protein